MDYQRMVDQLGLMDVSSRKNNGDMKDQLRNLHGRHNFTTDRTELKRKESIEKKESYSLNKYERKESYNNSFDMS